MIIQPKVRGFICTTAHPTGCFKNVEEQINYVKSKGSVKGPKNVLIIGGSTGYGLASRIAAAFGAGANTINVCFERPAEGNRTATAGWYNTAAFEKIAKEHNYYAKTVNGDAFSNEVKEKVAGLVQDLGKIDLIVYSLASPRRVHPETGQVFSSVLKPIDQPFTGKTVDTFRKEVKEVHIEPASEKEIADTIAVMGGEDWEMWINFLNERGLLAEGITTIAYTYVGPELTHAIYKNGTIGKAKDHLHTTAQKLDKQLKQSHQGQAVISVNKALVTQASAAIPVVPLYISVLFKIMKAKGIHEGCIEQINRLFHEHLYAEHPISRNEHNMIRLDDLEMRKDVQSQVAEIWPQITTQSLGTLTDIQGYNDDFYGLFGFNRKDVDYNADIDPNV